MNQGIPTILFVDKNQHIRDQLQQLLHEETWVCQFISSAPEAMVFLENHRVDLIVCDTQTGNVDQFQLLTKVHKQYPAVVRIAMNGNNKQDNLVQTLSEGHPQQVIPKPWVDQEFKEIIRSAIRQSSLQKQHSPKFQALINSTTLLPALPESYTNVRSCIGEDEVDIERMAFFIGQDVAISSALLHWANSALFGQRFQVDTIKKAIIVLGTDIVENLVLAEAITQAIAQKLPKIEGFDLGQFKKHAMASAVLARLLIKSLFPSDIVQQDRAFVAGLLHDLGKLAAVSFFPTQFEAAITLAITRECPLPDAEVEIYGTQHAELGSFLAEWWTLPPFIVSAILWHHYPHETPMDKEVIIAAYVANLLSYQFGYGSNGETCPRVITEKYREKFYLSEEENEILRSETEKTVNALAS